MLNLSLPTWVLFVGLLVGLSVVWVGVLLNSMSVFTGGLVLMAVSFLPVLSIRAGRRVAGFLVRVGAV